MCFLSEVIAGIDSEQPNDGATDLTMGPFTQSIIVATMCGRALGLKQRFVLEHAYQEMIPEFYLRRQTLDTFLTARIKILSMQISSTSEHPDPLMIFLTLAAYMVVFMLYETIEAIPLGTEESHLLLLGHEQRSLDAVHELAVFTSMLTQMNHFQVRCPPAQTLCFMHCNANGDLDASFYSNPTFTERAVLLESHWVE